MKRRQFLVGTGAGIGLGKAASMLAACAPGAPPDALAPSQPGSWTWEQIRAEFPADPAHVHMTSFFLCSHPRVVREAIEQHRRGLDENPVHYLDDNVARFEKSLRRAAADYFESDPDSFAITDSTTMGLGLVYGGLALRDGQEMVTTTHDHIATHQALEQRAARTGAPLRRISLYDDPSRATADSIVAALERGVKRETRVVAVTWVHSGTGVKLPIRQMADALARINAGRAEADRALLFVDGVHGFGVEAETAGSLGCDFFIAGTHKWILGPRGTGLVWAKREAWPATLPTIPSMDPFWREGSPDSMPHAGAMTPGGFQPYEHRWAVEAAFRFHLAIGKERIAARIHELNRMCKEELGKLGRVRVATPLSDEVSSGIICFDVDGMDPYQVVSRLRAERVVASVVPGFYNPLHVRLAPSLLTLEKDVERAVAAVRGLT